MDSDNTFYIGFRVQSLKTNFKVGKYYFGDNHIAQSKTVTVILKKENKLSIIKLIYKEIV